LAFRPADDRRRRQRPSHYLILLDHSELLRRLYSRVVVPDAVASELSTAGAPSIVRDWIRQPSSWVSVVAVGLEAVETITDDLDLGERSRSHWRQPSVPISY
jgi:predicted nucleic acid-binding protein